MFYCGLKPGGKDSYDLAATYILRFEIIFFSCFVLKIEVKKIFLVFNRLIFYFIYLDCFVQHVLEFLVNAIYHLDRLFYISVFHIYIYIFTFCMFYKCILSILKTMVIYIYMWSHLWKCDVI